MVDLVNVRGISVRHLKLRHPAGRDVHRVGGDHVVAIPQRTVWLIPKFVVPAYINDGTLATVSGLNVAVHDEVSFRDPHRSNVLEDEV